MRAFRATALLLFVVSCTSSEPDASAEAPYLAALGRLAVDVRVPDGPALALARSDLLEAMARVGGVAPGEAPIAGAVVEAVVDPAAKMYGDEGYAIAIRADPIGLVVTARTGIGAAYGLWAIAGDLGVMYLHPDETWFPAREGARLPWHYDGRVVTPSFSRRGFHEHTQHPIPMSDYLLRPGVPGFREGASRELRWLARNRQNMLTFHMLKTVDLATWIPWAKDIVAEARGLGVRLGAVVSFADQQQNAFKLITDPATDAAPQIRAGLDAVLAGDFDVVGLQLGTSEFTRPPDAEVLGWLDTARAHLDAAHPGVTPFAWIHITCGLMADGGGPFFHLPLQSDGLGAFVHTTMFYGLTDPAPVYGCDTFGHQLDFIEQARGTRELVYFPESAWWLGFDNNVPLVLPVTGLTRQEDVRRVLDAGGVTGHVTFTTGREWTYWMIDHYLTRVTFDASLTWEAYLESLAPLYAEANVSAALAALTALQQKAFLGENAELYFYLAGELPQDEAGATAGVLARRPKLSFRALMAFDDAALAAWKAKDLAQLVAFRDDVNSILGGLPEALEAGASAQQSTLYREVRTGVELLARRAEHAILLYEGVVAARAGDAAGGDAKLAAARAISAAVIKTLQQAEADYREPIELLARPKPESPTSYKYGYLSETSTAYFWTRRDDQLAALLAAVFGGGPQVWSVEPDRVFAAASDKIALLQPDAPVAAGVIKGFLPQILFGVFAPQPGGALSIRLAADYDKNGLPDAGTEVLFDGTGTAPWTGAAAGWSLAIRSNAGEKLGDLNLLEPAVTATITAEAGHVTVLAAVVLTADLLTADIVNAVLQIAGIDKEGVESLLKDAFGLPASEPLPERLDVKLGFEPL